MHHVLVSVFPTKILLALTPGDVHALSTISFVFAIYYIKSSEIPSELSRENFISSHV